MEAAELVAMRAKTHGDWKAQATATAEIRAAIQRWDTQGIPAYQIEALHMIAVKMGRILLGDHKHKDHWEDIGGYAKLGAEACDG